MHFLDCTSTIPIYLMCVMLTRPELASSTCCHGDHCDELNTSPFDSIDDHVLEGHVINVFDLAPGMNCFMLCMLDCRCVSYNKDLMNRKCELNSDSNYTVPFALKERLGFVYQNVKITTHDGQQPSTHECQNSCCLIPSCLNGGECQELCNHPLKRISCTCAQGYSGSLCQFKINALCDNSPCGNRGTCVDLLYRYECICAIGFSGQNCEIDIDECGSNPCHNGATCQDGVGSYSCQCKPGYTGETCQTDIDECDSNPCQNGGTCQDKLNGYDCSCKPSYFGTSCEHQAFSCEDYFSLADSPQVSGWYPLSDSSGNTFTTACFFKYSSNYVYTLVMSYKLANNVIYQNQPFINDFPRNEHNHNWHDFRLSKAKMLYLKSRPRCTQWTMSCRYDLDDMNFSPDFIRVGFSSVDIFSHYDQSCHSSNYCKLKGNECSNIMVIQSSSEILHIASTGCGGSNTFYHYFGFYQSVDSTFQCSKSQDSTTQLWFRETGL